MKIFCFMLLACCLSVTTHATTRDLPEPDLSELLQSPDAPRANVSLRFNELNTQIRDGRINRDNAQKELLQRLRVIKEEYYQFKGNDYPKSTWAFPLSGYTAKAISGGKRHGYLSRGYDFYSGNRHGGHPSLDIFIRDRNRDSRDDKSGKAVNVLSMTGGIVVASEQSWDTESRLRGGKYIWVYDPGNDLLVYYAHNDELRAQPGDVVKPGDILATVGRSGYNAAKRRSPTHLHLTVLKVAGGKMIPVDVYPNLKKTGVQ